MRRDKNFVVIILNGQKYSTEEITHIHVTTLNGVGP